MEIVPQAKIKELFSLQVCVCDATTNLKKLHFVVGKGIAEMRKKI